MEEQYAKVVLLTLNNNANVQNYTMSHVPLMAIYKTLIMVILQGDVDNIQCSLRPSLLH